MTEKHQFLSDGWMKALEQTAQQQLDAGKVEPDTKFTYVECFTDVPAPRKDGLKTGYILTVQGPKVTLRSGIGEADQGDCVVQMDYHAALQTLGVKSGPELTALGMAAFAAGTLKMSGSLEGFPMSMDNVHDEMCARTSIPGA